MYTLTQFYYIYAIVALINADLSVEKEDDSKLKDLLSGIVSEPAKK